MFEAFGARLGVTEDESDFAIDQGFRALGDAFEVHHAGARARSILIERDRLATIRIALLMIGRPYHNDPGLNHSRAGGVPGAGVSDPVDALDPQGSRRSCDRFFAEDLAQGPAWCRRRSTSTTCGPRTTASTRVQKVWAAKFAALGTPTWPCSISRASSAGTTRPPTGSSTASSPPPARRRTRRCTTSTPTSRRARSRSASRPTRYTLMLAARAARGSGDRQAARDLDRRHRAARSWSSWRRVAQGAACTSLALQRRDGDAAAPDRGAAAEHGCPRRRPWPRPGRVAPKTLTDREHGARPRAFRMITRTATGFVAAAHAPEARAWPGRDRVTAHSHRPGPRLANQENNETAMKNQIPHGRPSRHRRQHAARRPTSMEA